MITYNNDTEVLYDFNMIAELLGSHPSYLKREIKNYGFKSSEYVRYQNRHLYKQSAVVDFIIYLVKKKSNTGANTQQKNETT